MANIENMKNRILKEVFTKSKKTKKLIGIHERDIQYDDFCVGYVIDFNDTFLVIQHVTKLGIKDGIHIKEILTIEKVETDSEYIRACQLLLDNPELLPIQNTNRVKLSSHESWQYHFFNDNSCIGELIAFDLKGEDLFNFGFLIDFDEDNFIVHLIGQAGESQETNTYHIVDIKSLALDTLTCRKRKSLFQLRKNSSS
jgi:hypothetical protein